MCRPCQYRYKCACSSQPGDAGWERCIHYWHLNRMRAAGVLQNELAFRVEIQLCRNDTGTIWVVVPRQCGACVGADAKAERLKFERVDWNRVKARVSKITTHMRRSTDLMRSQNEAWKKQHASPSKRRMAISAAGAKEPVPELVKLCARWVDNATTRMILDRYKNCQGVSDADVQSVILEACQLLKDRPEIVQWIRDD